LWLFLRFEHAIGLLLLPAIQRTQLCAVWRPYGSLVAASAACSLEAAAAMLTAAQHDRL
jgi:hypothetical protein